MVNAIYQKRTDNVARSATVTIQTGTDPADTNYAPASLIDENPAKVAKINSTTAAWLFNFGSAQRVDLAGLIHHDFDAGADVKLQGNASDSWGSPTFSAAFTIPAWQGSGSTLWPVNPWMDVTAQTGYSASGFQYWRLVITSNSQNVQLGQVWLSPSIRRFTTNYEAGAEESRTRGAVVNTTSYEVDTIYPRHNPRFGMAFSFPLLNATQRTSLQEQWDDVGGRTYPWLFVPNGDVNACYLVRWSTPDEKMRRVFLSSNASVSQADMSVLEAARGLRPGT